MAYNNEKDSDKPDGVQAVNILELVTHSYNYFKKLKRGLKVIGSNVGGSFIHRHWLAYKNVFLWVYFGMPIIQKTAVKI
jgi:hypothetical protein